MLFVENISHLSIYCLNLLLVSCSLKVVETWICIANDLLRLLLLCSSGSVLAGTHFYLELGAQLVVFDLDLLGEVLVVVVVVMEFPHAPVLPSVGLL